MVTITVPLETKLPIMALQNILKRYECTIEHAGGIDYKISTNNPVQLFWLGMNINSLLNVNLG